MTRSRAPGLAWEITWLAFAICTHLQVGADRFCSFNWRQRVEKQFSPFHLLLLYRKWFKQLCPPANDTEEEIFLLLNLDSRDLCCNIQPPCHHRSRRMIWLGV